MLNMSLTRLGVLPYLMQQLSYAIKVLLQDSFSFKFYLQFLNTLNIILVTWFWRILLTMSEYTDSLDSLSSLSDTSGRSEPSVFFAFDRWATRLFRALLSINFYYFILHTSTNK